MMSSKKSFKVYFILLHLSALIFGGTALFSKFLKFPAVDIILFRGLFAAVILFFVLLFNAPSKFKLKSRKDVIFLIISGAFFGGHLVTYFYAMQISTIGIAVVSLFTFPMITTLVEPFIHKRTPELKHVLLSMLVVIGVLVIVSESEIGGNTILGVLLGIASSFFYSFRNLIVKYRLGSYQPIPLMFYQLLITFLIMLPLSNLDFQSIEPMDYLWLIVLTVVFTIVPHLAVIESLKKFDARSVGLILTLQVLYAIVFAHLVFDEPLKPSLFIGGFLVITTVVYESISLKLQDLKAKLKKKN
jgi:drug/metabolite transporter (DMT)-like permease